MKWLRFILSHSIFVALCAAALCLQSVLLLHIEASGWLYGFVFFATISSYNFYWLVSRYFSDASGRNLLSFLKHSKTQSAIMLLALAGAATCFFYAGISLKALLVALLLTLLYAIPLLPFPFLRFTRRAGVLKTCLLAFTWTYVTAFIPMQKELSAMGGADIFIFSRRFLFMLMLCIIFDSRDSAVDKIRGLRSLATDLSPITLRYLETGIFIVLFSTNFLFLYYGISMRQMLALQVSTVALLITYLFSIKKQGYFFYYFFVDGMMLFSALATYVAGI